MTGAQDQRGEGTAPETPRPRRVVDPALRRRRELQADTVMLVLCATVVVLSMLLSPDPSTLTLFGWELPGLCVWKNMTGMDCLGCGLTRSFAYMGHGQVGMAWELHKLGPALFLLCAGQVPWRLWMIRENLRAGADEA